MDTQHPQQSDIFRKAILHLFNVEGGYVDDALDAGGKTKFGISQRQYPLLNIAALTQETAVEIYHRDYWLAYQCDQLPESFACFLFDAVVNHRPRTAVRFLQNALRVEADGHIGPKTLGAARTATLDCEAESYALAWCQTYRADFYHDLVMEKPSQERFLMGWLRRLFSLQQFIALEVLAR